MKKYIEIGIGNTWLVRTEIEHEDGTEREIKGMIRPFRLKSVYFRVWIGKKVMVIDLKEGIKLQAKNRNKFKIIIGFYGT